jgi:2-oxoisovalerate dehydrogenase E1 component
MPRRKFYGGNAIVGGGLPLAGGLALADKMTGEDRVTACFFGDGAVAEGEFHETLNLAELWDLPVLFVCENNGYAMGTAIGRYESQTDIRAKAAAYNIAAEASTAWTSSPSRPPRAGRRRDPRDRAALLPGMQHLPVPRPFHVRRPALPRQDGVETVAREGADRALPGWLLENGLIHDSDVAEIEARVDAEIAEAVAFAEAGTWEPVEDLTNHVLGPQPAPVVPAAPSGETVEMTYREAVKQAIRDAMIRDERVFLMGEDVGAYGGCYAVSKGLMDEFGEDRIRDTPLSEVGFTGAGIGAAAAGHAAHRGADDGQLLLAGARPDHEHGGHHPAHVGRAVRRAAGDPHGHRRGQAAGRAAFAQPRGVVRPYPGPEGAGARHGGGCARHALDRAGGPRPGADLRERHALQPDRADRCAAGAVDITTAAIRREGTDISLITYGGSLHKVLEAAEALEAEGINAEVIDLRTLRPLDDATIMASVGKTRRAVIVDEGWRSGSLSAEISARIMEQALWSLDARWAGSARRGADPLSQAPGRRRDPAGARHRRRRQGADGALRWGLHDALARGRHGGRHARRMDGQARRHGEARRYRRGGGNPERRDRDRDLRGGRGFGTDRRTGPTCRWAHHLP